jgi:hypothetical protein
MEFVPVAAMAVLILKLIDFARYCRAADLNGVITQLSAWAAGVIVVFLVAQTDWASGIGVGDQNLETLNAWSLFFYGLSVGSGASLIKDSIKAIDNTNSAQIPTLMRRSARHRAVVENTIEDIG